MNEVELKYVPHPYIDSREDVLIAVERNVSVHSFKMHLLR
jgi:hypothetical protein